MKILPKPVSLQDISSNYGTDSDLIENINKAVYESVDFVAISNIKSLSLQYSPGLIFEK